MCDCTGPGIEAYVGEIKITKSSLQTIVRIAESQWLLSEIISFTSSEAAMSFHHCLHGERKKGMYSRRNLGPKKNNPFLSEFTVVNPPEQLHRPLQWKNLETHRSLITLHINSDLFLAAYIPVLTHS